MGTGSLSRGLTTNLQLALRLKKEYSYNSKPILGPLGLHGLFGRFFYLFALHDQQFTVPGMLMFTRDRNLCCGRHDCAEEEQI